MTISPFGKTRRSLWYPGWNVVGSTLVAQIFSIGLSVNCLSLFLIHWSGEFHAPVSEILLAIIPTIVISGLFSPILGAWSDKYPARWIFGVGLVGLGLGFIALSRVTAVWQIWAVYTYLPFASCACGILPASALVSRWFVKRAALALAIMSFGQGIAGMVASPIVSHFMPVIGWRDVWLYAGLITLLATPLLVVFMRDKPTERDGFHYLTGPVAGPAGHGHGHGHGASDLRWSDIFHSRNFWLLTAFFVPVLSVYLGVQQNLGPIVASLGLDATVAGTLIAIYGLSHAIATLVIGIISDRLGNRQAMAGLALFVGAGVLVIAFAHSFPLLVLGAVMCGAGGGMWPLLPVAASAEFGASGVGRAFGAIILLCPISAGIPSLIAKVKESSGSYEPAMYGLAMSCVIAAVAAMMIRARPVTNEGRPANA